MSSVPGVLPMRRGGVAALALVALLLAPAAGWADAHESGGAAASKVEKKSEKTGKSAKKKEEDVAVDAIDAFIEEQSIDKSKPNWKQRLPKPPKVSFAADKSYYWVLETNQGALKVELLADEAPMHVSSTIYLTRLGFYDSVPFHRVIPSFMAQGGDPTGSGRGNPGYRYDGEFGGESRHDKRGVLSMANAGPGTDGSQFFITFAATPHLDGKHTVFGRVVEGMGTLDALEARGTRPGRPTEPLEIQRASIVVE